MQKHIPPIRVRSSDTPEPMLSTRVRKLRTTSSSADLQLLLEQASVGLGFSQGLVGFTGVSAGVSFRARGGELFLGQCFRTLASVDVSVRTLASFFSSCVSVFLTML